MIFMNWISSVFKDKKNTFKWLVSGFLFLYIFSIPSFGGRQGLNIITYACMILLAIFVILYFLFYKGVYFKKEIFIIPTFTLFAFIGTIIYSKEFRGYVTLVLLCLSFLIVYFAFCIICDRNLSITILIVALSCFFVYFIIHFKDQVINFSNYGSESFRLGYPFDNPNGVASICVVGFTLSLFAVLFFKTKLRFFALISLLLSGFVGICTGSRTFIIMSILVLLILLFFCFKKHKFIYFLVVASLIVSFIILINLPFLNTIKERFIRIINTFVGNSTRVDTSSISRITWLKYGFFLGNKSLFIGYGYGGFAKYSGVGTYAHSNFSEVFCDFGIIGLLLFYSPLFYCAYKCIKRKTESLPFIITIVIYYCFASLANVFFYNKLYYIVLSLLFSSLFGDMNFSEAKKKKTIKKVIFTCDRLGFGGAERVIVSVANYLAINKIQVTIVGVSDSNTTSVYPLNDGVQYLSAFHEKRKNKISRVLNLRKTITELRPDLIISFLPHVNIYTYFSILGLGVPLVVSERNNPFVDPKNLIIKMLKYYVFCNADGVVFQTEQAMDYYHQWVRHKSVIIKNPLDDLLPSSNSNIKEKTILYVGRLVEQKNVHCLLDAFYNFHKTNPDYTLRIYGSGPLESNLKKYSNSIGISQFVSFVGNRNDWHSYEKNDSVFVLPSNYEGFPNSLMEALAIGIPCVATDSPCGGSKELIKENINGFLCNVNDPIDMSNKMRLALEIKVSKEQVDVFRSEYSIETIGHMWFDFIQKVQKGAL